jgi:hypothetical protein
MFYLSLRNWTIYKARVIIFVRSNTKLSIEGKCRETVWTHSFIVMSAWFWIVSPLNHWEIFASSGSGATPYPCCPEVVLSFWKKLYPLYVPPRWGLGMARCRWECWVEVEACGVSGWRIVDGSAGLR